ncbi:MAG: hypothetical protein QME60_08060 [Verrucomicrobiota bacterium]|nr:hypothetical protein [Verrucomicrobiota bacterium]
MKNALLVSAVVLSFVVPVQPVSAAGEKPARESDAVAFGPYFIGYETEPAMEAGGRLITTVHGAVSDAGWRIFKRLRGLPASHETLLGLYLSVVQHEVFGHGSRAREYKLNPEYGFGNDFSGYTEVKKDPRDNLQMVNLSSGGTEADSVLARRILLDMCRPGGWPACSVPLMFFAKTDLSLYVLSTSKPKADNGDAEERSFVNDYENGNDIAIYLASRQAQRLGGRAGDVWNRDYEIDFAEVELKESWNHARAAATWNLADPMLWGGMFLYIRRHLIQAKRATAAPAIPLGHGYGLTAGTRAALAPDSVTRFLDLYFLTPAGIFSVYGRDLTSTEETTMGFGAGVYHLRAGPALTLSLAGDVWRNPSAPEEFEQDDAGWNLSSEAEISLGGPVSLSFKAGGKSEGYFPGAPNDAGAYGGAGVVVAF